MTPEQRQQIRLAEATYKAQRAEIEAEYQAAQKQLFAEKLQTIRGLNTARLEQIDRILHPAPKVAKKTTKPRKKVA